MYRRMCWRWCLKKSGASAKRREAQPLSHSGPIDQKHLRLGRIVASPRRAALVIVLCGALACGGRALAACLGDCSGDGTVTVDELVLGVNIALGTQSLSACPAFDDGSGTVKVNQLVTAVNNALEGCASGVTFNVNTVNDAVADFTGDADFTVCRTAPNNHVCSLRAAVMTANRHAGGATITLPAGTYLLQLLPTMTDDDASGDLNITGAVTIVGAGAATTVVDGGGSDRVFRVESGAALIMSGVTTRHGVISGDSGGGIVSHGQITLSDSVITGNHSMNGGGGGLYAGPATLTGVVIDGNSATFGGGGLNCEGPTTLTRVTVAGNSTGSDGGGIYVGGDLTLTDSTVDDNHAAGAGGGLISYATLTVFNSTISNNSTGFDGGGIEANNGAVRLFHTTIAGNLAGHAGLGGYVGGGINIVFTTEPVQLWNTLLADNYVGNVSNDCAGNSLTSEDYNYFQSTDGCMINGISTHNVIGGDPLLASLADNGGATQTRALLAGSPAIDQIPPAVCRDPFGAAPVPDQRGIVRPVGSLCDIGAYEGQQPVFGYQRNLVRNGDAEIAAGSPTGGFVGVPNWSSRGGQLLTVVPYNAPGGFPSVSTDTVPAVHGLNFFAGGNSAVSVGVQDVDLSPLADSIDADNVTFDLSADLGGYLTQGDNAELEADFLDQSTHLLSQVFLGPVTAADRSNLTGLLHRDATGQVPAQTRTVELFLTMTRASAASSQNDGYADNISFVVLPKAASDRIR